MKDLKLFLDLIRIKKPIGIMLLFWPCLWGLTLGNDFSDSNLIVISPGDTIALKLPNCTVANLRAMTCSVTNGTPTADGGSGENALIEIAAILDLSLIHI